MTAMAVALSNSESPEIQPLFLRAPENSISVELTATSKEDVDKVCVGKLWSISRGFLRVMVDRSIEPGASVTARFHGCLAYGEAVFCQESPAGYNVGVQLSSDPALRREPRFPLQLPGTLTVLGDQGPVQIKIELIDVSPSGVGLTAPEAIPTGVSVEINLECGILLGEVRHCERVENRFRAGVKMYDMIAKEPALRRKSGTLLGLLKRNK